MKEYSISYVRKIYENYLIESGYRENSIRDKLSKVQYFFQFLDKDIDFRNICKDDILKFLEYIEIVISERTGKPLSRRTKLMLFGSVRLIFRCLYQHELIITNPAQDIRYKPKGAETRREILTPFEMNRFLDSIDQYRGLRDRAMFELMYSSGLRCSEVSYLDIKDIDFENRMILIRQAKWGKDRIVPCSEVAMSFLKQYLYGRLENKELPVFVGVRGRIQKNTINRIFKKLLKKVGMYREGLSSHSIRHSVSVHLISNGLDLRFVQELLNHESIETTCGYTNDLVSNIKRVYKTYAPRENEYYKEIDDYYLKRIEHLLAMLNDKKRLKNREKHRMRKGNTKSI